MAKTKQAAQKISKSIIRDLLDALDACTTQIHQMRGMFNDEDGTIQDALDAAEDAEDAAHEFLKTEAQTNG